MLKILYTYTISLLLFLCSSQEISLNKLKLPNKYYVLTNNLQVLLQHDSLANNASVEFWIKTSTSSRQINNNYNLDKVNETSSIIHTNIDKRPVSIYLPSNYNNKSKYKVIYFNDGQYLFKTGWNLENVLDKLIKNNTIQPIIVVGIHSNNNTRNSDYIPFNDQWINLNLGTYIPKTKEYSNFIRKKVIPYIESNYPVAKGSKNRALAGASFGGLHAIWDGLTYPDYWNLIIAFSPSFWVNNHEIFEYANNFSDITPKIWFDIGATTGEWNYYIPIIEIIKKKNLKYGKELFYYEDPNGYHTASSWSKRIIYPLIIFAGNKNFTPKRMTIEIEVIKSSSTNKYFQRVNPMIHLENGVVFSASNQVKYKLINATDGLIKSDGRFIFYKKKNLNIKVTYKNLTKKVVIEYSKIEKISD